MAKKSVEALTRVFCRDCYRAVAFVGNGCFCRGLMSRVCAAERYGHPITFCRGFYVAKAEVQHPRKDGEKFVFRGAIYKTVAANDFKTHCYECDLRYFCSRCPDEVQTAAGVCRGVYFVKAVN